MHKMLISNQKSYLNGSLHINVNVIMGIMLRGEVCTSKQKSCPRMLLCKGLM